MFEQTILYSYSRNHGTLLFWLSSAVHLRAATIASFLILKLGGATDLFPTWPSSWWRCPVLPWWSVFFVTWTSCFHPVRAHSQWHAGDNFLLIIFLNKSSFWAMELEIFRLKVFAENYSYIWTRLCPTKALSFKGYTSQKNVKNQPHFFNWFPLEIWNTMRLVDVVLCWRLFLVAFQRRTSNTWSFILHGMEGRKAWPLWRRLACILARIDIRWIMDR